MPRGNSASRWPRIITALVVALFATVASERLFLNKPDDALESEAMQDVDVAGRLTGQFVEEPEPVSPAPNPISIALTLDSSAPIDTYLESAGLNAESARRWARFFESTASSKTLLRGHSLTLYKDAQTGDLRGFRYNLDDRVALSETTYGDGVIRSSQELIRYVMRPVAVSFRLKSDFSHEAARHDLPQPIIATLEYAFKNRHPLNDLPRGSNVKLIYQEKVSRDGSSRQVTGLEAAQIRLGGETFSAFAFRDENGQAHLYDASGEALGPESLRFPLNYQYISSGFTERRYHPILQEYRPHEGVDLAAQYGTPVKAVADGRVESAGWCGGLGRCVRIVHESGIVSIYGHLSRISPALEAGTNVRVGEVIGRVGSSGLSTGPHLHYALERDGHYVNPLTASLGIHHHVSPRMRNLFDHLKQDYLATLNRLPDLGGHFSAPHPGAVALSRAASTGDSAVSSAGRAGGQWSLAKLRTAAAPRAAMAASLTIGGRASVSR
jgi:murein DD-endopeptidase MepM/ murein hydrolase activator NlpD